ncbi:MAG: Asp-tRNA(Asn)/Glu-tRNA(Gln) amidotransferase subunit GatA [Candidatus Omnitrophica bacterium]|nr:Asp-tRNA(Asn)/Glu-tRNA(Gln) amidotransferase subunit GatA [Candidatus Omnitrophota bacterium]MDD5430300.1 Asp-tRNA(Asn)/Glu-tRNA(Gln) amidotransferase subunit GatA [Candidatus Omnitrophota bacterium]
MNIDKEARQIAENIYSKKTSKEEVFRFFHSRAKKVDSYLKSFVEMYDNFTPVNGDSSLGGLPIAIKDNICIEGKRITCASKILSTHVSAYDSEVVRRLKKAGLIIFGTTNMDEFAFGSSTENSCYGPTRNPWDTSRVAGGSSGGSAAAVAARLVPFALGSDTGGSIRQPCAFCGVVGFKPTYGRVSRYGLVAFGSSLDQIGPITTSIADSAHLLNIICGFDRRDSTSVKKDVPDFTKSLSSEGKKFTIGIPQEYFGAGLNEEIRAAIEKVISLYKKNNIKIAEVSLPHTEYAVAAYYIIASSEASSNLQRFDGIKYGLREPSRNLEELYCRTRKIGFGDEVKRRIFLGTYSLSSGYYEAYYIKALKARRLIRNDFNEVFKSVDAILTPTTPTPAFKIGEKKDDPLSMYLSDIYTISVNLAGIPAVSLPCGFTKSNLPISFQLIGKEFDEETLLSLGSTYQSCTDFHKKVPPLR